MTTREMRCANVDRPCYAGGWSAVSSSFPSLSPPRASPPIAICSALRSTTRPGGLVHVSLVHPLDSTRVTRSFARLEEGTAHLLN